MGKEVRVCLKKAERGMIKIHVTNSQMINKDIYKDIYIYIVSQCILYLVHILSLYTSIFILRNTFKNNLSSLLT